jgi:ribonuclease E
MPKEMLINVSAGEECRIALLEDGRLEELYMERTSSTSHVGNIYKGRVTNVEPSIQAAFIDFGLGRNGFLHISDLMPTYFGRKGEDIQESVGRKMSRRDRPPIQRCLRRGDEVLVQIIKEGIGTKGPTLSTYLSIPGKILVMMPGMGKMGVSKKIEDETERRRLRQILNGLKPPKDVAFIIRTAGIGKSKVEIERDLKYLTRLWETIQKKEQEPAPVELYTEGDLVTRTVRDLFSTEVERIVVDNKAVASRVKEVIKISSPRARNKVELYEDPVPLFHKADIEREIEMMYSRHVPLPSGGSLVIDSTEAVVAIDVNSGKFRDHNDAETTAFKTDMEAADEIPRQLKLRDLGGVIICDFIDLRYERHRRELEERLFENFKNDRAKTKVLRMSQFGIIEITRQRMRPSLKRSIYFDCPHCKGAGLIKTPESISLDVMRKLSIALNDLKVVRAELSVCPDVAFYLLNKKRANLTELEDRTKKKVLIRSDASLGLDELKFELFDARDFAIILEEIGMTLPLHPHTSQLRQPPAGHTHQGRSAGRNQRGRNDRNRTGEARSVPAKAMEDDDDLDEDLAAIDDRDDDMDQLPQSLPEREEDPTDIPAILETEAGDEIAEDLADEERNEDEGEGEGQDRDRRDMRADARGDNRDNRGDRSDIRRDNRDNRDNRNNRGGEPRRDQRDNRPPQQNRQGGQQQFNNGGGFNNGQGGGPNAGQGQPGEGGGRRRRRRGRRGRGRGGEGQNRPGQPIGNQPQGREGYPEPNGNSAGYPRDDYDDDNRDERDDRDAVGQQGERAPRDERDLPVQREGNAQRDDRDQFDGDEAESFDESTPPFEGATGTGKAPATPQGDAPLEGDQPRRRRRRRGGRRHRRGNRQEQGPNQPVDQFGQPIAPASQPQDETRGDESDYDDENEDMIESSTVSQEAEPATAEAPAVEPEPVEETDGEAAEVEEVKPAKTPRKRAAKPKAEKPAKVVKEKKPAVARKRVTRKPPKAESEAAAPEPIVQPPVVRTGSADKHLASDEPVLPPTVSRPRSYVDLDAIPDDYD